MVDRLKDLLSGGICAAAARLGWPPLPARRGTVGGDDSGHELAAAASSGARATWHGLNREEDYSKVEQLCDWMVKVRVKGWFIAWLMG